MHKPLSEVYESHLEVVEDQIDEMNHVNNLVYLQWALHAAVEHSSHVGWTPARYRQEGAGFIVRSHGIKYKRSAQLGDGIVVKTWIADMQRVSSLRKYEIRLEDDGKLLAVAETNWVFVDLSTQELRKIPPQLVADFAPRD